MRIFIDDIKRMNINENRTDKENDYLDEIEQILPWQRSLTSSERIFIVLFACVLVSIVGCIVFYFVCSQKGLRQRYSRRRKKNEEKILLPSAPRDNWLVYTPPAPQYESVFHANNLISLDQSNQNHHRHILKESPYTTASDSDGVYSTNSTDYLSGSSPKTRARHSLIKPIYLSPPFAQINTELIIDNEKKILLVHLTNLDNLPKHPVFDVQTEYFIHIQLVSNKIYKKFHDLSRKRRSSLSINTWRSLQEKSTKRLFRTNENIVICDEYVEFQIIETDLSSTSLRFLLFCTDHTGIEDLLIENLIHLNQDMIPKYDQVVLFHNLPQISFAELHLGINYLPTAERLTVRINRLHYFCKIEKDQKLDARLTVTYFHQGRRFFQKKFAPIFSKSTQSDLFDINENLIENIPSNDLSSIYIHFELILHLINLKDASIFSCGSILLGEQTRYKFEWQKLFAYPRQNHFAWYQFYG